MAEFTMPSLGADMEEGVLADWFVGEGETVERGQVIAAVDTDKAVIDVEVFTSGVVERLLVEPGTTVAVGAPLAVITEADPGSDEDLGEQGPAAATDAPPLGADEDRTRVTGGAQLHHASRVLSPLVRRLAERLHVDPTGVDGTGPGGRVTRSDVERAATAPTVIPPTTAARAGKAGRTKASPRARRLATRRGIDLAQVRGTGAGGAVREADVIASTQVAAGGQAAAGRDVGTGGPPIGHEGPGDVGRDGADSDHRTTMRNAIARAMTRSNAEIPHYHLTHLVDLAALQTFLEAANSTRPPADRLLPAAALLKATALAANDVPELNGFWVDDGFRAGDGVHVAVAVALRDGGLIAPVIHHADRMSLDEVMEAMRDLVQRARRGGLRGADMQTATLTVTNLGDRGVDTVHGVIHPPQVALVGAGRVLERPLVVDGDVVARPSVVLTLAADHRATDGQTGSRMLNRISSYLQQPEGL